MNIKSWETSKAQFNFYKFIHWRRMKRWEKKNDNTKRNLEHKRIFSIVEKYCIKYTINFQMKTYFLTQKYR